MNPSEERRTAQTIDPDLLSQIIEQYEETARPFGKDEAYSEEDAKSLGLPSPSMLNFLQKFVKKMIGTPFVPAWIAGSANPAGTMLACILRGRELDFKAMESLEVFWKAPDGRLAMWSKTMMALMRKSGFKFKWIKDTADECEVQAIRPDGDEYTAHFGHEDALTAGLWDKNQSMHKKYPANMNRSRCITMIWNTLAADLGGGPVYSREEVEEELRIERNSPPTRPEPETNPFVVSQAPKAETKAPVAETKQHVSETKPANEDTKTHNPEPETHKPDAVQSGISQGQAPVAEGGNATSPKDNGTSAAQSPAQAGPVADPEPPKRGRGRPPKAPEGPAAMDALKASAPPEQPKGAFQATDDDLPAGIGQTAKGPQLVPPQPALSQVERLKNIESKLEREQKRPTDYCNINLRTFVKAFLRVDRLPKPPDPLYEAHLPLFESYAAKYGANMLASAEVEGSKAGVSWAAFVRKIDKWPDEVKALAKQVAIQHYPDEVMNLTEFMEGVAGIAEPGTEMCKFLLLLRISKEALKVVREAAGRRGKSIEQVVSGLNLDGATEAQVLSVVAGGAVQSGAAETEDLWQE